MADYLSRDDVLRKFIEGDGHDDDHFTEGYNFAVQEHREKVKNMPAADVQPISQWISVKDRLPKEWYEVLVYSEMGKIEQAIYVNGRWKLSAFLGEIVDVTHWQPLPAPPKDGDTE